MSKSTFARPILRSGQTLIGLLVVVAILIALSVYFLGGHTNKQGQKVPGVSKRAIDMSKEVQLNSNIKQINEFIFMYKNDNDGKVPASLDELKKESKYPASMFINPVDKKPLNYDPKTGRVWPTPYKGQGALGRAKPQMPGETTPGM